MLDSKCVYLRCHAASPRRHFASSPNPTETSVGAPTANVELDSSIYDIEPTGCRHRATGQRSTSTRSSNGRWVALDHADLAAAAQARLLNARKKLQMTGGMLRQALGLVMVHRWLAVSPSDGSGGPLTSWREGSTACLRRPEPEGFKGELRSYQADALACLPGHHQPRRLSRTRHGSGTPTIPLTSSTASATLSLALRRLRSSVTGQQKLVVSLLSFSVHTEHGRSDHEDIGRSRTGRCRHHHLRHQFAILKRLKRISWGRIVLDEATSDQTFVKRNPLSNCVVSTHRRDCSYGNANRKRTRRSLGHPISPQPGLAGPRPHFIAQLSATGTTGRDQGETALR